MSSKNIFRCAANIQFADSEGEFYKVVSSSPKNNYLQEGNDEGPIKFLYLGRPEGGPKKFFFVQLPDGEIIAACGFYMQEKNIYMMGVSVHPDYRNQNLGRALTYNLMSYADKHNAVLKVTKFQRLGQQYLAPAMFKLHSEFPNLRIVYNAHEEPVGGTQPYKLEFNEHGYTTVTMLNCS